MGLFRRDRRPAASAHDRFLAAEGQRIRDEADAVAAFVEVMFLRLAASTAHPEVQALVTTSFIGGGQFTGVLLQKLGGPLGQAAPQERQFVDKIDVVHCSAVAAYAYMGVLTAAGADTDDKVGLGQFLDVADAVFPVSRLMGHDVAACGFKVRDGEMALSELRLATLTAVADCLDDDVPSAALDVWPEAWEAGWSGLWSALTDFLPESLFFRRPDYRVPLF